MCRKQKSKRLVEIHHDSHGEPGPFIDCSEYRLDDDLSFTWTPQLLDGERARKRVRERSWAERGNVAGER